MKYHLYIALALVAALFTPAGLALAQQPIVTGSVQYYIVNIIAFGDAVVVPFLFAIALVFLVVNVIRYFIVGSGNPEKQEKAKYLALYSVLAFVFISIFWGIVAMLNSWVALDQRMINRPCPDFLERAPGNPCLFFW
jgi:succinate dehydrogenase/fumarate reductase cytochrome b subunit